MQKVKLFSLTCWACPSQWEGSLSDNSKLYVRYRWGTLTVSVDQVPIFSLQFKDMLDGHMCTTDMQHHTENILDWSEAEDLTYYEESISN